MCFSPIVGLEESRFLLCLTVEQKPEAGACFQRGLPPTLPDPGPAHTPAWDSSMGLAPTEILSSPLSQAGRRRLNRGVHLGSECLWGAWADCRGLLVCS